MKPLLIRALGRTYERLDRGRRDIGNGSIIRCISFDRGNRCSLSHNKNWSGWVRIGDEWMNKGEEGLIEEEEPGVVGAYAPT